MFSHVMVGTNDLEKARSFYDQVMSVLGFGVVISHDQFVAYGSGRRPNLFVTKPVNGEPAQAGNGVMVAFEAKDRATVDRFFETVMANGGKSEGEPGLRPHYHASYYGAYVRDRDGNKLHCVCHKPEG